MLIYCYEFHMLWSFMRKSQWYKPSGLSESVLTVRRGSITPAAEDKHQLFELWGYGTF